MNLQDAAQLGTIDDVKNLIDIFINIMTALLPLFGGLIGFYIINKIYRKINGKKKKQHLKTEKKQMKNEIKVEDTGKVMNKKVNNHLFENDEAMMEKLNDISEPINKKEFDSLYLEFGKDGKVIKGE